MPPLMFDLERDLLHAESLCRQVKDDPVFAHELYAALCNTRWVHQDMPDDDEWSCTWRFADAIVQEMGGTDYYYASGNEGTITERVRQAMRVLSWTGYPYIDQT